jgi:MerR family transcriptional regulator, copper efflux regulator
LLIGELAARGGVTAKTLRFYEHQGLLAPPHRTPSGYRDYDDTAIPRLQFIHAAQAAGFTLREIAAILRVRDEGEAPCTHVQDLISRHLAEIDQRLQELQATRRELRRLAVHARTITPNDCPSEAICRILQPAPQNPNRGSPHHQSRQDRSS